MPLSIIGWRQDKTRKEVLTITNHMKPSYIKQKKKPTGFFCGAYGTRTRDPLRDRQIF